MENKTYNQLCKLEDQVKQKLSDGGPIDVEYWEVLLKALVVWKAKAKIKEMHTELLANRIEQLREKQKQEKFNKANPKDHEDKSDKKSTHENVSDNEEDKEDNLQPFDESLKIPNDEEGEEGEEEGDDYELDAIKESQKVTIHQQHY